MGTHKVLMKHTLERDETYRDGRTDLKVRENTRKNLETRGRKKLVMQQTKSSLNRVSPVARRSRNGSDEDEPRSALKDESQPSNCITLDSSYVPFLVSPTPGLVNKHGDRQCTAYSESCSIFSARARSYATILVSERSVALQGSSARSTRSTGTTVGSDDQGRHSVHFT